jgi:integrase
MPYARPPRGPRGKYWTARWRDVDGRNCEEGGFVDQGSALNYAKDQEYLVRKGKKTSPSDMNLTVKEFIEEVWVHTISVRESSATDYEYSINGAILPEFGDVKMKNIKPADIEAWLVKMKKQLIKRGGKLVPISDRVIEKRRLLLASILKKAVANEYLHKSPFATLSFSKAKTKNAVTPLTYDKVVEIVNHLSPRYQIMVWIGYYTAMRPSEVLGLTYDRLDFDKSEIRIDRQISRDTGDVFAKEGLKTEASDRVIGFPSDLKALINTHVQQFGLGPEQLIMKTSGGKVFRYKGAIEMWREAARKAGLEVGQGLHQLRHACVSNLISEGANPKEIQEWVGHTSIQETMDTYGHLFPNAKHSLASMLDNHSKKQIAQINLNVVNQ